MANAPTAKVQQLRQQGYTNSQIIDILQRDGHSSSDIFDALSHAGTPNAGPAPAAPAAPESGNDLPPPPSIPDMPQAKQPAQGMPEIQDMPAMPDLPDPTPASPQPAAQPSPQPTAQPTPQEFTPAPAFPASSGSSGMQVSPEEYIESVIDEKWASIEGDIQKIIDWKNRSEHRLSQMESTLSDVKGRFEQLHAALVGKIDTYDKNILEVGAEIKAMEKVFSKVLPAFTDNIKQLADITDRLGEKTGSPKTKSRVSQ